MTTPTLIERLRKVESALEFFNETAMCQADTDVSVEALADLRNLIKELERAVAQ